ncbi:MAG: hypothetical protein Q9162_002436 [Coniocarpon cinnabarinum]
MEQTLKERKLKVVIVGGSLAGLLNGIMLSNLGHDVHILEQSHKAIREDFAAGMNIGFNGKRFFADYDRHKSDFYLSSKYNYVLDKESNPVHRFPVPLFLTRWPALYYRLRAMFDGTQSPFIPSPQPTRALEVKTGKVLLDPGKRVIGASLSSDGVVRVEYESSMPGESKVAGTGGTVEADFVVDSSGANSVVLHQHRPNLKKDYSGFVGWRGAVAESEVSEQTRQLFRKEESPFFITGYSSGYAFCVGYTMPGENGTTEPGKRYLNVIVYQAVNEGSTFFNTIMTDSDGHFHRGTLPRGKMSTATRDILKDLAKSTLDPAFQEIFVKTEEPFLTAIFDCFNPNLRALNDRLVWVGEAATLMRPTGGRAFDMCAEQSLLLRRVMQGEITLAEWEVAVHRARMDAYYFCRLLSDYYLSSRLRYLMTVVEVAVLGRAQRFWKWWTAARA